LLVQSLASSRAYLPRFVESHVSIGLGYAGLWWGITSCPSSGRGLQDGLLLAHLVQLRRDLILRDDFLIRHRGGGGFLLRPRRLIHRYPAFAARHQNAGRNCDAGDKSTPAESEVGPSFWSGKDFLLFE